MYHGFQYTRPARYSNRFKAQLLILNMYIIHMRTNSQTHFHEPSRKENGIFDLFGGTSHSHSFCKCKGNTQLCICVVFFIGTCSFHQTRRMHRDRFLIYLFSLCLATFRSTSAEIIGTSTIYIMSARKDAQFSIEELENVCNHVWSILDSHAIPLCCLYADIMQLLIGKIESSTNGRNSGADLRKVEFNVA